MKTLFHKLYLTVLIPLVLLGVGTPVFGMIAVSHDVDRVREARACWEMVTSTPWSEAELKTRCRLSVYTNSYSQKMDVYADDIWVGSSDVFSKKSPYENFWVFFIPAVLGLLWAGFGRWVRWLAKPVAATTAAALVLLAPGSARADGPGHFGLTSPGDAVVASWSGCRKTASKNPALQELGTRGVALYCSCMTDAIRILNPGIIDATTSLVIPSGVQAGQCLQDVMKRVRSGDQRPKGYFGIERKDIPTENVVSAWASCVQALPKTDDGVASRQCGCVADAMRANFRYPFRADPAAVSRAAPTEAQIRVCEKL